MEGRVLDLARVMLAMNITARVPSSLHTPTQSFGDNFHGFGNCRDHLGYVTV